MERRGLSAMNAGSSAEQLLSNLRERERDYIAAFQASGRLEQLGAGSFYLSRLQSNALVPGPEWHVLNFILKHFPVTSHIVEIGCGWGQILAMAAAAGYSCTGLDVNVARLEGAKFLRSLVDRDFRGVSDRLRYLQADFPVNWADALDAAPVGSERVTIGFFSNLGVGKPEEFCDLCVAELHRFDFVIMDVVRFFTNRVDRKEQDAFIEKMDISGIGYCGDIYYNPRAYRFIVLSVGDPAPFLEPRIELHPTERQHLLIDSATSAVQPVRATVEVIKEVCAAAGVEQVMRVREDDTAGNAHDIRLFYPDPAKGGRYELVAVLRAGERRGACILLHHNWRDHVRIMVDLVGGETRVANVLGDTFRVIGLKVDRSAGWTRVKLRIELKGEPRNVGISVHLLNEIGQYYYDGDGHSTLDVGVVRLASLNGSQVR